MLIKSSSSSGLQKILNTSETNRSGYTHTNTHTHTHTNKSASNKTRNHFLTSRTVLMRCVFSGVPWKRCLQDTEPKHIVKLLDLICIAESPHLLYWKILPWKPDLLFPPRRGRAWFISPPNQVRGVSETAAIILDHLIHFILSCELSCPPPDGHNAPLNLPPEQNSPAVKWTIRFHSAAKRSNGSDAETLSVTRWLPKLYEPLLL